MGTQPEQMESASDFTRVRRTSLSDHIVEQIAELVSRGTLKPGDRIPSEKELCEKFGVGRTSVREALRSLSVMGVLDSRMGDGTFVTRDAGRFLERSFHWGLLLNSKVVENLIETRLMLESHTAFLAASKATPADLERIEATVRRMGASLDDASQYLQHDLQFHLAIAQATQNSILQSLLSMTRGYLQAWIRETLAASPDTASKRARLSVVQHKRILKALKEHDAAAARQAMAAHIASSSTDLRNRARRLTASLP